MLHCFSIIITIIDFINPPFSLFPNTPAHSPTLSSLIFLFTRANQTFSHVEHLRTSAFLFFFSFFLLLYIYVYIYIVTFAFTHACIRLLPNCKLLLFFFFLNYTECRGSRRRRPGAIEEKKKTKGDACTVETIWHSIGGYPIRKDTKDRL